MLRPTVCNTRFKSESYENHHGNLMTCILLAKCAAFGVVVVFCCCSRSFSPSRRHRVAWPLFISFGPSRLCLHGDQDQMLITSPRLSPEMTAERHLNKLNYPEQMIMNSLLRRRRRRRRRRLAAVIGFRPDTARAFRVAVLIEKIRARRVRSMRNCFANNRRTHKHGVRGWSIFVRRRAGMETRTRARSDR